MRLNGSVGEFSRNACCHKSKWELRQVELKREKLSIMADMMADEKTCTADMVRFHLWQ